MLPLFDLGPPRQVSCTICIDVDGTAWGIVDPRIRPYTTGNAVDDIAITIEIINSVRGGTTAESWLISDAAYATVVQVVKWMDETYNGFAIDRNHIRTHRDYNPATLCPGALSVERVITMSS